MSYRPFSRRKKNDQKNLEAIEVWNMYNRLVPTTRVRYNKVIEDFADFLLIHRKSLWDTNEDDIRKYFLDNDSPNNRTVLTTFYRILIQSGQYERSNPMEIFLQTERRDKEKGIIRTDISTDETANVLQQLDETKEKENLEASSKTKSVVGKKLITNSDLEKLLMRVKSIRDRTILITLFSTGIKLKELTNLLLSDVDIEARQVSIRSLKQSDNINDEKNFRTILLPRRTISYLRIYERWRRRILSPVPYYFITTGKTKKQMSESAITNWLKRIQKDRPIVQRWTAMDFRKRALLQQYWITRDLTAVARFGGYRRPESALRLIADALNDQGVDSIDKLGTVGEFDKVQKTRTASVSDLDNLSVTVELQQSDLEFISKTGQTPTQFIRSLLRYQAGSGDAPTGIAAKPASGSTDTGLSLGGPSLGDTNSDGPSSGPVGMPTAGGEPKISGPKAGGGPNLGTAPSGGPNLSAAPPSKGPNLSAAPPSKGPSLGTAPSGGPSLGGPSSAGPSGPGPSGPGGPGGPGGGMQSAIAEALGGLKAVDPSEVSKPEPVAAQVEPEMTELQKMLARRREKMAAQAEEEGESSPAPSSSGFGTIRDAEPMDEPAEEDDWRSKYTSDDDEDEDEELPDLPDFDL